ncbi:putative zinc metalloprotease [Mucidula mucida]|nr:putative zinc metalloprotease [Mucidula mucida]
MTIAQKFSAVLGFRTVPTTVLVVLIYLATFISVLVTDQLANVPKNQRGLNLDEAYADLHQIAARPHSYNSHANDNVRSYLLKRVKEITAGRDKVFVDDDLQSNGSWASGAYGVYFEGTNILVKIEGTDPEYRETGGVLFSAHYDSVSTASGATDDGMGVATLLQLLSYFVEHRPKRTAVWNINNGEEDWLNGAHAFLRHPWSNTTHTFLNLEGAASGGRPLLFRATSSPPLLSFSDNNVPHPHANVLSSDAFARGVIRSGTDFSVYYEGADMSGLDLAFYKGRSKYHTKYDAIPHTVGEKKALWAMMESAKGSGLALLNDTGAMHSDSRSSAVYFDLFGVVMILFPLSAMITFNIVFLVIGPVILILVLAAEAAIQHNRRRYIQNGDAPGSSNSLWDHFWSWFIEFGWLKGFLSWAKFWIALIATVGLQVLLVYGYLKVNPFIAYSAPYLAFLSFFSLAYLSMVLVLNLPIPGVKAQIPEQQKQTVLVQTYIFTWILLVYATAAASKTGMGGFYLITMWNVVVFLACCIGGAEGMVGAQGTHPVVVILQQPTPAEERTDNFEEVDENTPLIPRTRHDVTILGGEETGAIGWWIIQILVVIPVPLILVSHITTMLVGAMSQTLADGSSPVTVYGALALLAVLMLIPLAPFSFKMHQTLTYVFVVVLVATTLYGYLSFPFNQESPLKVFFQQNITVSPLGTHAITTLSGVSAHIASVISHLPSAAAKDVVCIPSSARLSLQQCGWESDMIPSPASNFTSDKWLNTTSTRTGRSSARISVRGLNTRSCRLYFEDNAVTKYHVHGSEDAMQPRYEVPVEGIKELRIWSRTWDKNFTVDVELAQTSETSGRIACEWNEYESGTVGIPTGGKIPAFEEVLTFLPKWAAVTKLTDGLVEVSSKFTI